MRKYKEERPVLAICYDFDKTLSPDDMQAQGYIQEVYRGDVADFWRESNAMARDNGMDTNLAYMYKMVEEATGRIVFNRQMLAEYGAKVALFPGVEGWFERIREYGREHGVIVEHYIISSGLKEMIEGTSVAKAGAFERIYASSFLYSDRGVAVWPAQAVNYTNKTQFLFRIEKGVLDLDDAAVNDYFPPEELRVPFRNMVYIGDSDTDIPCMKLVNSYGGHSIGVYNAETCDKTKVFKMMRENRIRYFAPADYSEGSPLDRLLKTVIEHTALNEKLETSHQESRGETREYDSRNDAEERERADLILALEGSGSFSRTHDIIAKMMRHTGWSAAQKEAIFKIASENSQVLYILQDQDLRAFFRTLLEGFEGETGAWEAVRKRLEGILGA